MKFEDVIRVAIEREFDISKASLGVALNEEADLDTIHYLFYEDECYQEYYVISIAHLVFLTDFIDKLVGEGEKEYMCVTDKISLCAYDREPKGYWCSRSDIKEECPCYKVTKNKDADYHRSEMANMKDIDKLKAYCVGLIEEV